MIERCDSRFEDSGSDLLCSRTKGHDGFHMYGDWEWMDEKSNREGGWWVAKPITRKFAEGEIVSAGLIAAPLEEGLLTVCQAIERAEINQEEIANIFGVGYKTQEWILGQLNKLIARKLRKA